MKPFHIQPKVSHALKDGYPVVALESTVITHGLPHPQNLVIAQQMEETIRSERAIPATIALLDGKIQVGLSLEALQRLSTGDGMIKVSLRDFGYALGKSLSGGTTVAGTMFVAYQVGIRVFATGGIGGVHRSLPGLEQTSFDISTDLFALASYPVIVVCAGAKAILDLPATLEVLETLGVPVIGYQTDELPAFYSLSSGLKLTMRADTPEEVARIAKAHWALGFKSGVLVVAPPPVETALATNELESAIDQAMIQAKAMNLRGQMVTPFLLEKVSQITGGKSIEANLALLDHNAQIAAQIAGKMTTPKQQMV